MAEQDFDLEVSCITWEEEARISERMRTGGDTSGVRGKDRATRRSTWGKDPETESFRKNMLWEDRSIDGKAGRYLVRGGSPDYWISISGG